MRKKEIKIGEVGDYFNNFKQINFDSNQSLFDFDVIFLDINYVSSLIYYQSDEPYGDETLWVQESKKKVLEKRAAEIKEFVKEGRSLVMFLPKPQTYQFVDGNYSTGETFVNTALSPRYLVLDSIEGEEIEIIPKTKFTLLLKKFQHLLIYKSCFIKNVVIGNPLAKIRNTDRIIASFEDNFMILPALTPDYFVEKSQINLFAEELVKLLFPDEPDFILPEWTAKYLLPSEKELHASKVSQLSELKEIENRIVSIDKELNDLKKLKVLITGTGNALEQMISSIFESLGFNILQTDYNRDDLIVEYHQQVAVIEIKGVTKSATEEHAMQLEKWVTEYSLEKGVYPKGMLIVNSFREIELSKRNIPSFPDQMKKFSTKRDHCLLTSIQLLGLYYDCISRPLEKDSIIASLFNTIGEFPNYKNWNEFLILNES